MNTRLSWYKRYQPKNFEDIVFPDEPFIPMIHGFYTNGLVKGNILAYGKPGTGKTATILVLIDGIIKHPQNVIKLGRKTEDVVELKKQLQVQIYGDKQKVVFIDEMDKLSQQAQTLLKDGLMEDYQHKCTFLATTNKIKNIDEALVTRFNLKINFDELPETDVLNRLKYILEAEKIAFQEDELLQYIRNHSALGLREMINDMEIYSSGGTFKRNPVEKTRKSSPAAPRQTTDSRRTPKYTFVPLPWLKPQKATTHEIMLNRKEVLQRIGVAPTNMVKEEVFKILRAYDNSFNTQKKYKASEVDDLIASFKVI